MNDGIDFFKRQIRSVLVVTLCLVTSGLTAYADEQPASRDQVVAMLERGATDFSNLDLRGARVMGNLQGADLEGANLAGVRGSADMRNQPMGLVRAELAQAVLRGANLEGAQLARANLNFTDLTGATLTDAVLSEANVENAVFRSVKGLSSVQGFDSVQGKSLAEFD